LPRKAGTPIKYIISFIAINLIQLLVKRIPTFPKGCKTLVLKEKPGAKTRDSEDNVEESPKGFFLTVGMAGSWAIFYVHIRDERISIEKTLIAHCKQWSYLKTSVVKVKK
jgi:hypothetical protein